MLKKYWFLLSPGENPGGEGSEGEGSEGGESGDVETKPDTDTDNKDLPDPVKEVIRKEREAAQKAEKAYKAESAARKAAEAKLAEKEKASLSVEERLAVMEKSDAQYKLEKKQNSIMEKHIGEVGEGFKVDRTTLLEELGDLNINSENVEAVVARAVKRNTRPDNMAPAPDNKQGRSDPEKKMDPLKPRSVEEVFSS